MTFEEMIDRIENTENDVLFVKEGYVEKAKEVLEDAGIDSYQATIKDLNAIGILKDQEMTKQKIMERIPERKRNTDYLKNVISSVGDAYEENAIDFTDTPEEMIDYSIKQYEYESLLEIINEKKDIENNL